MGVVVFSSCIVIIKYNMSICKTYQCFAVVFGVYFYYSDLMCVPSVL